MSIMSYSQHYYNCVANNIEVYFEYNNSVVFDTGKETITSDGCNTYKCKELSVITKCELEQYGGPSETHRYSRGDNLVIQGIITFFTGNPLTVYHSNKSSGGVTPIEYEKQEIHIKIDDVDYSGDLLIMLDRLNKEPELIITLLDRWRKAIYLKEESYDADLYYDEATLSFFHIFELFGESIAYELKSKLENNIESMLYQHFKSYYYSESQTKQMVEQNTDNHQTAFTVSIDGIHTETGISAFERSETALAAMKDDARPEDFRMAHTSDCHSRNRTDHFST